MAAAIWLGGAGTTQNNHFHRGPNMAPFAEKFCPYFNSAWQPLSLRRGGRHCTPHILYPILLLYCSISSKSTR